MCLDLKLQYWRNLINYKCTILLLKWREIVSVALVLNQKAWMLDIVYILMFIHISCSFFPLQGICLEERQQVVFCLLTAWWGSGREPNSCWRCLYSTVNDLVYLLGHKQMDISHHITIIYLPAFPLTSFRSFYYIIKSVSFSDCTQDKSMVTTDHLYQHLPSLCLVLNRLLWWRTGKDITLQMWRGAFFFKSFPLSFWSSVYFHWHFNEWSQRVT